MTLQLVTRSLLFLLCVANLYSKFEEDDRTGSVSSICKNVETYRICHCHTNRPFEKLAENKLDCSIISCESYSDDCSEEDITSLSQFQKCCLLTSLKSEDTAIQNHLQDLNFVKSGNKQAYLEYDQALKTYPSKFDLTLNNYFIRNVLPSSRQCSCFFVQPFCFNSSRARTKNMPCTGMSEFLATYSSGLRKENFCCPVNNSTDLSSKDICVDFLSKYNIFVFDAEAKIIPFNARLIRQSNGAMPITNSTKDQIVNSTANSVEFPDKKRNSAKSNRLSKKTKPNSKEEGWSTLWEHGSVSGDQDKRIASIVKGIKKEEKERRVVDTARGRVYNRQRNDNETDYDFGTWFVEEPKDPPQKYYYLNAHNCRGEECVLGNIIADSFVAFFARLYNGTWADVGVALVPAMNIVNSLNFTLNSDNPDLSGLRAVIPKPNLLVEFQIKGSNLRKTMEIAMNAHLKPKKEQVSFLQVSGLIIKFNPNRKSGERIDEFGVRCAQCSVPKYSPLDPAQYYRILAPRNLVEGGFEHKLISRVKQNEFITNYKDVDVLEWYLSHYLRIIPERQMRLRIFKIGYFSDRAGRIRPIFPLFFFSKLICLYYIINVL